MDIEARLERLESSEAARSVLAGYAAACDAQDVAAIEDLFCEDAEVEAPGALFRGRDRIRSFFADSWRADPSTKSHFVTNVTAGSCERGRAQVSAYFFYTARLDPRLVLGWGRYEGVVDSSGSRPRFARLSISVGHTADLGGGAAVAR